MQMFEKLTWKGWKRLKTNSQRRQPGRGTHILECRRSDGGVRRLIFDAICYKMGELLVEVSDIRSD